MLGGRHQNERGCPPACSDGLCGDQQGRNAADIRGRHRRAGCELHAPVGRRHQNIHARRRDGDVVALVGAVEQTVVFVGRGDGHDVRIGARIKRRRFRTGIAGGGDEQDALLAGDLQRLRERRIVRPGEAHVDDPGAVLDRVIEAADDLDRVRVRLAGAAEGADRDDLGVRRDAQQLSVRHDRSGHAGAVRVRRRVAPQPAS